MQNNKVYFLKATITKEQIEDFKKNKFIKLKINDTKKHIFLNLLKPENVYTSFFQEVKHLAKLFDYSKYFLISDLFYFCSDFCSKQEFALYLKKAEKENYISFVDVQEYKVYIQERIDNETIIKNTAENILEGLEYIEDKAIYQINKEKVSNIPDKSKEASKYKIYYLYDSDLEELQTIGFKNIARYEIIFKDKKNEVFTRLQRTKTN